MRTRPQNSRASRTHKKVLDLFLAVKKSLEKEGYAVSVDTEDGERVLNVDATKKVGGAE